MSKLAKKPIIVAPDINCQLENNLLKLSNKNGNLQFSIPEGITVSIDNNNYSILVNRTSDEKQHKALQGTVWSIIRNMVLGLQQGFTKELEIIGVGYNAKVEGKTLVLNVGYNHPIKLQIPDNIEVKCLTNTLISIKGIDKRLVGQFAINVKNVRPINVYTLKGIRFKGEVVKQKPGKAIAAGTGGAGGGPPKK